MPGQVDDYFQAWNLEVSRLDFPWRTRDYRGMIEVKNQFADGGRSQAPRGVRDKNACTVNALANTTGMAYEIAHAICAAAGREKGKGFWPKIILKHAKKYGVTSRKVLRSSLTLQKFIKKHPQGKFYVASSRHAFAVVDGVVLDWKDNGAKVRLKEGYEIEGTYNGKTIRPLRNR